MRADPLTTLVLQGFFPGGSAFRASSWRDLSIKSMSVVLDALQSISVHGVPVKYCVDGSMLAIQTLLVSLLDPSWTLHAQVISCLAFGPADLL